VIANGCPDGSSLSATAQDRYEQTPNVVSRLEETGPESYAASQAYDSGELSIEDSSPDKASGKP
jgi:hypothetical protein